LHIDDAIKSSAFSVGDRVSIFGVKSRPKLNGELAVCVKNLDGRWQVKLSSGEEISLKEEVLTAAPVRKKKKSKDKKKQGGTRTGGDHDAAMELADRSIEHEIAVQEAKRAAAQALKEAKAKKDAKNDAVKAALKETAALKNKEKLIESDEDEGRHTSQSHDRKKEKKVEHEKKRPEGGNCLQNRSRSSFVKTFLKP